jgi:hypothetical protein
MQVDLPKARKKFFIAHTRSPVLNAKNFLAIRITNQTDTELLTALQPLHNCTCVSFTGIKAHTFSHETATGLITTLFKQKAGPTIADPACKFSFRYIPKKPRLVVGNESARSEI